MRHIDSRNIYSVTEVNYFAKQTLEQMIFWVEGEISELKAHPSLSFYYLKLKDEKAILPCISNRYIIENLGENLVGQKILAYGNLSLYEVWGKYQFRILKAETAGEGVWQRRLAELIQKLKAEGLFDQKHKKPIPRYPKRVCVVTSEGSDAVNDFKRHTIIKFPIIELAIADVRVQGPNSIPSLLKVLPLVDKGGFDAVVITRGGGSIEDLAAFNNEQVARTIFAMKTPTIVAIGHEANESLAEWTADVRASTPTDAANIVTSGYNSLLLTLDGIKYRLSSKSTYYFSTNFQRLDHIHFKLQSTKNSFKDLPHRLNSASQSLKRQEKLLLTDAWEKLANIQKGMLRNFQYLSHQSAIQLTNIGQALEKSPRILNANYSQQVENLRKSLSILSPQNTLARGYSITTDVKGRIIKNIKDVVVGNTIGVKLTGGSLTSKVLTKVENG